MANFIVLNGRNIKTQGIDHKIFLYFLFISGPV